MFMAATSKYDVDEIEINGPRGCPHLAAARFVPSWGVYVLPHPHVALTLNSLKEGWLLGMFVRWFVTLAVYSHTAFYFRETMYNVKRLKGCPIQGPFSTELLEDPISESVGVLYNALGEPPMPTEIRASKWRNEWKGRSYNLISFSALSTESEPWQMLRPTAKA